MTIEQKFNYMTDFPTYWLDGEFYFALPMKYPEKEYQTMNNIFITDGYFLLDMDIFNPYNDWDNFDENYTYEQLIDDYNYWLRYGYDYGLPFDKDELDNAINQTYNTLIEFENRVKQLNEGAENDNTTKI